MMEEKSGLEFEWVEMRKKGYPINHLTCIDSCLGEPPLFGDADEYLWWDCTPSEFNWVEEDPTANLVIRLRVDLLQKSERLKKQPNF